MPPENLLHRPLGLAATVAAIRRKLDQVRLDLRDEKRAQEQFAQALEHERIPWAREWSIPGTRYRIDFMIPTNEGTLGLEMKRDGTANAITRQLIKYAQAHPFQALVLLSTVPRAWPLDSIENPYGHPIPLHIIEQRNL